MSYEVWEYFLGSVNERKIGNLSRNIKITISLDSTKHSDLRRFRHSTEITDNDILSVAEKAIEPLTRDLIDNSIDVGDQIAIRDSKTNLNLVAQLNEKNNVIEMRVITVMIKKNFRPKTGTKVIDL